MLFYNGIGPYIYFLFFLIREFKRFHCNSAYSSVVVPRHIFKPLKWHEHQNSEPTKFFKTKFAKRPQTRLGSAFKVNLDTSNFQNSNYGGGPLVPPRYKEKCVGKTLHSDRQTKFSNILQSLVARKLTLPHLPCTLKPDHHQMLWLVPSTKSWASTKFNNQSIFKTFEKCDYYQKFTYSRNIFLKISFAT